MLLGGRSIAVTETVGPDLPAGGSSAYADAYGYGP
jgi:hypothetical protein